MRSTMPSPKRSPSSTPEDPWALSGIEQRSADLVAPVRNLLTALCRQPAQHARFLNTLSMLEHIGSRKIMTSQTTGPLGCEVLKHLCEEARHAFFFKRQAEKIAGRPLDYSAATTIAAGPARMYFGRLDAGIGRALAGSPHSDAAYLFVSLIIELRAIWAYQIYHQVLSEEAPAVSLKSLLAEEEHHLPQMVDRLTHLGEDLKGHVPAFAAVEDRLFRGLWSALEAAVPATVH